MHKDKFRCTSENDFLSDLSPTKQPVFRSIAETQYILVNRQGQIISLGTLSYISFEWAKFRYQHGEFDYEVREVKLTEIKTLTKDEIDEACEQAYPKDV